MASAYEKQNEEENMDDNFSNYPLKYNWRHLLFDYVLCFGCILWFDYMVGVMVCFSFYILLLEILSNETTFIWISKLQGVSGFDYYLYHFLTIQRVYDLLLLLNFVLNCKLMYPKRLHSIYLWIKDVHWWTNYS